MIVAFIRNLHIDREWLEAWVSESRKRIKAARADASIGAVDLSPLESRHMETLQAVGVRRISDLGAMLEMLPGENVVVNSRTQDLQSFVTVYLPPREVEDAPPTFVDLMAA